MFRLNFILPFCSLLFLLACATNKVDWQSRVGNYTYDQAVLEMGVPDRSTTLSDGSIVGEWLTVRGTSYGTISSHPGSSLANYDVNQFPDRFMRLTFSKDGKLTGFQKFAR
jgi:hypothetical protein